MPVEEKEQIDISQEFQELMKIEEERKKVTEDLKQILEQIKGVI
jgi:type I restriction-modification system DNA methylase subunit